MAKRPAQQPSERRLKQYRGQAGITMSVGITGARAGDLLRGVPGMSSGDTANVLLRLDTGEVKAPGIIRRTLEEELGREVVVVAFAKHFGISHSAAAVLCPAIEPAETR